MTIDTHTGGLAAYLSADARGADPAYARAYDGLLEATLHRRALAPVERELIGLAASVAITALRPDAVRDHVRAARELGASAEDVIEVCELASVLGIHSITICLPVVLEICGVAAIPEDELDEDRQELKRDFQDKRGTWSELWGSLLQVDPEFFAAYTEFSGVPWRRDGGIGPKLRELIYVAVDASTTHLLVQGVRAHGQAALRYGATLDELLEVLEIVALIGAQSVSEGVRALAAG